MTPTTRSTAKNHKQHHAPSYVDETPTLVTLLQVIDQLKTNLHTGIQDIKLAISDTNADVDLKITTITNTIDALHDTDTSDIVLLRSDVCGKIDLVYNHVNDTFASA